MNSLRSISQSFYAIIITCLFTTALLAAETPPAEQPTEPQFVKITVVEAETNQPIADARVKYSIGCNNSVVTQSNEQGISQYELPNPLPDYLGISISSPGRVTMAVRRDKNRVNIPPKAETLTIALTKGTVIGGTVQNENGEPIEGVNVEILLASQGPRGAIYQSVRTTVQTDEHGQWRCDVMPEKFNDVWLKHSHDDYISDNSFGQTARFSAEQLRDMSGVAVMEKGLTITGHITDAQGKPIADALVSQGEDRFGTSYPKTRTDEQGFYQFNNTKPGTVILTVHHESHAPDLKEIQVGPNTPPINFQLQPGKTLRGKVVNQDGQPLTGATIYGDSWRGYRTPRLKATTDENGQFVIEGAPVDAVLYDIMAKGYMRVRDRNMVAGETEYTVTLPSQLIVSGKVVDAETNQPIKDFTIITGIRWENRSTTHWQRDEASKASGGEYEQTFSFPYPMRLIRIEADKYMPAISRPFTMDEGQVTYDFKLEPAVNIRGLVQTPDELPVAEATVIFAMPGQSVQIQNARSVPNRNNTIIAETATDGSFSFSPQPGPWKIIVLSDEGYAEIDDKQLAESSNVTVQPWARVSGILRVGDKPGAQHEINIRYVTDNYNPNEQYVHHNMDTTTDEHGRFTFDRVMPGKISVSKKVQTSEHSWSYSHQQVHTVAADETLDLTIGGMGRPVIAKVVMDNINTPLTNTHCTISTEYKPLQPDIPDEVKALPREEMIKWYQAWQKTDEGKTFIEKSQQLAESIKRFPFGIEADGSIRVEDVPTGTYEISIRIYKPQQCGYGDMAATYGSTITIPEIQPGQYDEPFDIGEITLEPVASLNIGEPAPDFEHPDINGNTVKLSDLKGKYILLDFWATWCGPCLGEMPNLEKTYEQFGRRDDFVMIGLSIDQDLDTLKQYVDANKLGWTQIHLDGAWNADTLTRYGVNGVPSVWLIDPEGKIVGKDIRGEHIETAVAKHLGN